MKSDLELLTSLIHWVINTSVSRHLILWQPWTSHLSHSHSILSLSQPSGKCDGTLAQGLIMELASNFNTVLKRTDIGMPE